MRHETPDYLKQWRGYIILPDALNYPQLIIWQDAIDAMRELGDSLTWQAVANNPHMAEHVVKAFCALVKEWHLDGLPDSLSLDTFPATPRTSSILLMAWLGNRITALFEEAEDTPEKKAA